MKSLLSELRNQSFAIVTAFTLLTVVGVFLVPLQSLRFAPSIENPAFLVTIVWPDATARTLENEVISQLEAGLSLISGVSSIRSRTELGSGEITLEIEEGLNLDMIRFEISARLRWLYQALPDKVEYPIIHPLGFDRSIDDRPILTYALVAPEETIDIYQYARDVLGPGLGLTKGVERTVVRGGLDHEWRISLDMAALSNLAISQSYLEAKVKEAFDDHVLGVTHEGKGSFIVSLQAYDSEPSLQSWAQLPIANVGGHLVYLGQVASVSRAESIPTSYYRINAKNSVRLLIYPQDQTNQIHLANRVKRSVARFSEQLPPEFTLYLEDDATEYLRSELRKIRNRSIWSLTILVVFLLILYRRSKYLILILTALVVNLSLASIGYYIFKVELHLYALAAVTVSFGIIIDNAIVTAHHLSRRNDLFVFPALVTSTLTTIASLVAIFLLPDQWQSTLGDFARALIINLTASLVVALLFVPAMLQRLNFDLPTSKSINRSIAWQIYRKILEILINHRRWVIGGVVLSFGLPIFMLPSHIEGAEWYNQTWGNDWIQKNIRPNVDKVLGGTLRLFIWNAYREYSFRQPEETVLYVQASMPPGSTVHQLNDLLGQIDNFLLKYPSEISRFTTNIFSNEHGYISIFFNSNFENSFAHELKNQLIARSANLSGADWNIFGVGGGFNTAAAVSPPTFQVKMRGYNIDELSRQADLFADVLRRHPRIHNVNTNADVLWYQRNKYIFQLEIDRRDLLLGNIVPMEVMAILRNYNQSTFPSSYLPGRRAMRFELRNRERMDLWNWENTNHRIDSNRMLYFPSYGKISKVAVPTALYKEDQQYIRSLEFEYTGSHRYGDLFVKNAIDMMRRQLPLGYVIERSRPEWGKLDNHIGFELFFVVVGLIFIITSIHFESIVRAFQVVILIPISFIGIFVVFHIFKSSFDQGGVASFLMLSGLVVNGLILILNDWKVLLDQKDHVSEFDALLVAIYDKCVPILLSIVSTILGMIPFLAEGKDEVFWFSLALGTIGGLAVSVVILFFVMPCFVIKDFSKSAMQQIEMF